MLCINKYNANLIFIKYTYNNNLFVNLFVFNISSSLSPSAHIASGKATLLKLLYLLILLIISIRVSS